MLNPNQIIQTADAFKEAANQAVQTDELLSAISALYLERCKALHEGHQITLQLLTHKIADLRSQLDSI